MIMKAPRIQSSVTPVQTTTVEKLVETFSEIRIRTCIYPQPGPKDPFPDQWKSSVKTDEQVPYVIEAFFVDPAAAAN